MALIKVSEIVKEELEQLKEKGEFKSLDAVIRYYINSFVEVCGGIFLGSDGVVFLRLKNLRDASIHENFTSSHIVPPKTIRLYKCLKCQTTDVQKEDEMIIVPNCMGCGKGMIPITIQIGFEEDKVNV